MIRCTVNNRLQLAAGWPRICHLTFRRAENIAQRCLYAACQGSHTDRVNCPARLLQCMCSTHPCTGGILTPQQTGGGVHSLADGYRCALTAFHPHFTWCYACSASMRHSPPSCVTASGTAAVFSSWNLPSLQRP